MHHELGIRNYGLKLIRMKLKSLSHYSLFIILAATLFVAAPAQAINWNPFAAPGSGPGPIQEDLRAEIIGGGQQAAVVGLGQEALNEVDLRVYVLRIVRGALGFVGLLLIIYIIYGGFLYMTSQGNEEKTGTAKKVLTNAAVGTFIILTSYAIVVFVNRSLQKAIFEQMITQAQHCSTTTGQATCCPEWNAYQTAISDPNQSGDDVDNAYDKWKDCFETATEGAGLPSNPCEVQSNVPGFEGHPAWCD